MHFVQLRSGEPRPARVLLVDDDAVVRRPVARFLRARGLTVVEAGDGNDGLAALCAARFDAVVTDVSMPNCDGLRFWTRATERHPGLRGRFLFCTASDVRNAVVAAGERFLRKPFELDELWSLLEPLLPSP